MPFEPQAADWLPIREVTRLTGVHPVTLRAWERRYGLVVPHRTAKGHRLYDAQHIARIQQVLTWLNRGVAVSQVKQLLDTPEASPQALDNDWQQLRQTLIGAIAELAERRLDDSLNQAMALYPPNTLCELLLLPLLAELEHRWQGQFGAQMERVFFYSWLRSKLGARIYHNNRQVSGPPVLLVNQSDRPMEPHLWITAWLISSSNHGVQVFDWPLPPGELALACDTLQARAVLLCASTALNVAGLRKLLSGCQCPKWLIGPAVRIHHPALAALAEQLGDLQLAESPLMAQQALQHFTAPVTRTP